MTSAAPARPARGLERTRGGGRYARGQVLRVDGGARGRYRHPPREDRSPRRRGSGSGPPATPPRAAGRRRAAGGGRRGRVVGAVAGGARHAGPVPGRAGGVGTGLAPGRLPHGLRRGLAPRHVRVHPVGTGRLGLGIRAETGGALYSVPGGQPGHAPSRVKGVDDPGQRMLGEPAAPVRPGGIGTETRRAPARPAPTDVSMAVAGTAGRRRGLAGADWLARQDLLVTGRPTIPRAAATWMPKGLLLPSSAEVAVCRERLGLSEFYHRCHGRRIRRQMRELRSRAPR
jgi:hypothetical protein